MDRDDGVMGLAGAALLAWLLPTALGGLLGHREACTVLTAHGAPGSPSALTFRWHASRHASAALDGRILDPSGAPPIPIPGWRGLLLGHPLDLNAATAADLEALPGIGPHTAAAVLAHRAAAGPFAVVEELAAVRGVGPATLARLRPLVRVRPPRGPR